MSPEADRDRFSDPLTRRARATPDRVALVDAETGTTWRYDELRDEVDRVAAQLADHGLEPGDHLGLLTDTSLDAIRVIHAAWRLGLVVVPLNVRLAGPTLGRQSSQADVDRIVCSDEAAGRAPEVADVPVIRASDVAEPTGDPTALATPDDQSSASSDWTRAQTALILFTSGTTGQPKAVRLTMGNLLASATASAFRLGVQPADRWLLCLPIYHMGGLAPVLRSAHYGTGLVVRTGFDAATVIADTHEYDVTGLSLVPTMLGRILDAEHELAPSVRAVLLGGAPATEELVDRCAAADVPVHPTYGLTETASQVATARPAQAVAHPGTVGQPLLGTEVTIVDDTGAELGPGDPGELVVRGPTVSPGYYGDPAATDAAFGPEGLRTGDRGYRDEEHRLWVLGRLDDVIITGGEKVQPESVVRVLEGHEDVAEAAVVGIQDAEWGERVVALVVPSGGNPPTPPTLREHCRTQLADFAVPKAFAVAETLPRTASGTVDRAAVRERFEE